MDKNDPFVALDDTEVRIVAPDYSLKKLIGENVDIKQIFSAENIENAQQIIHEHKDNFLEWVNNDLAALEHSYNKAMANLAACEPDIKKLAKTAFVIKSQAGTFGFELATRVAKSLDDFCNQTFKPIPEHMTAIRKHIDTLLAIFRNKISGDGGTLGAELIDNLFKLVEKCKKQ